MNFDERTRGFFRFPLETYGKTVLGSDLLYLPSRGKCKLLVVAGIHGEEPETTFLLSRCIRLLDSLPEHTAFVLCANPDGMTLGTRGNFNGVDLNRNFPATERPDAHVYSRSVLEAPRDTILLASTGESPEPEVTGLLHLIELLHPEEILSIHAPIGCVDASERSPVVESLCLTFDLPWVPDIGYPTPGSLGTWCKEHRASGGPRQCVTLELPRMSLEALFDRYAVPFTHFLERCP